MKRIVLSIAALLWLMSMHGCANFDAKIHYELAPMDAATKAACSDTVGTGSATEFVGVALSGGGSRAAVFGAASLEALWEHGLIDLVTHISSVSGGSIASSYYVANPPACAELAPGSKQESCYREYFHEFKQAMRSDYKLSMEWRQFIHPNRWLISNSRRATSLQEAVDERFLHATTFGDLADRRAQANHNGRHPPVLLINAGSYDNGRRFVFSNLCMPESPAPVTNEIVGNPLNKTAVRSLTFSRPDCARPAPRDLPVALAVATSASFPPVIGPVTIAVPSACTGGQTQYWHLGDGGTYENSGVDSLEEVILHEHRALPKTLDRALIVAIDAGMKEDESKLMDIKNFWLLRYHPGLITESFNNRAQGYHDLLWKRLDSDLSNQGLRIERINLRYTSAKLDRWPASCEQAAASVKQSPEDIRAAITAQLAEIETTLSITDCNADLLEMAAKDVVGALFNAETKARLIKLGFSVREPHVAH
jgi:predicted acylesterase/phospholipase RssA